MHTYMYINQGTTTPCSCSVATMGSSASTTSGSRRPNPLTHILRKWGTMRLETLVELQFLNSSVSSLSSYWNSTKHYMPSDSSQQYLSQQYPPPLFILR